MEEIKAVIDVLQSALLVKDSGNDVRLKRRERLEFAQEFAEQQVLASVGSVQVQISRILRERGAVEPRRPRPQGDRVPPRLTPLTEALLAASGAGSLEAALDIATNGIEPPSDTAVALAATIVVRSTSDPALAKRLAAARTHVAKGRA